MQAMEAVRRPSGVVISTNSIFFGHEWHKTGRGGADWGRSMSNNGLFKVEEEQGIINAGYQ